MTEVCKFMRGMDQVNMESLKLVGDRFKTNTRKYFLIHI